MAIFPGATFGLFIGSSADIDLITGVADIYYDESHNMPVTKTKYPIEDGSSMTDNAVVEPEQLILKGIVSDLESDGLGIVKINDGLRSKEAWGRIKELKNSRELVTATTLMGVYENMLVINAEASVNKDTGLSLFFTLTLEETLIAETDLVQLAPSTLASPADAMGSDINGGAQQSEVVADTTLLQDTINKIAGVFF